MYMKMNMEREMKGDEKREGGRWKGEGGDKEGERWEMKREGEV